MLLHEVQTIYNYAINAFYKASNKSRIDAARDAARLGEAATIDANKKDPSKEARMGRKAKEAILKAGITCQNDPLEGLEFDLKFNQEFPQEVKKMLEELFAVTGLKDYIEFTPIIAVAPITEEAVEFISPEEKLIAYASMLQFFKPVLTVPASLPNNISSNENDTVEQITPSTPGFFNGNAAKALSIRRLSNEDTGLEQPKITNPY